MRNRITAGLIACALVLGFASSALAQDKDDLLKEIRRLNNKIDSISAAQDRLANENAALRRDNEELKDKVEGELAPASDLEKSLNALADTASYAAGTTVNSVANPITLTGAFRFRAGFASNRDFGADINGSGNDSGDDSGTYVDARINVAFDFALSRNVTAHFEMISAGLFENDDADPNTGQLDEVNLYQGWVLIDKIFGRDEMGARFGRQEIVLGNELHFGNNSFFGGETHDAVIAWWGQEEFSLTLVWAKYDVAEPYNASGHPYPGYLSGNGFDDDEAFVAYFTLNTITNHVLDLYYGFLNANNSIGTSFGTLGNAIPADTFAHFIGIRLAGDLPDVAAGLDYNVEFTYETGDIDSAAIDLEGIIIEAELGITFNADNKFRVFGRFIYSEGPDDGDSGFVPLFVDRHEQVNWDDHTATRARWGLMDIIPLTNVISGQIGMTFMPADNWILGLTVLGAWRDEDVMTTDGDMEDDIGWEIDLFADYRYSDETTISLGLGIFLPNEGAPLENSVLSAGNDDDEAAFLFYLQSLTTF